MELRRFKFLNEKGQTAMEYMLLLIVAISIGVSFKKKLEEFVLTNPDSILTKQIRGLTRNFSDARYRRFSLRY